MKTKHFYFQLKPYLAGHTQWSASGPCVYYSKPMGLTKYTYQPVNVHSASVRHVSVCEFVTVCVSIQHLVNNKTRLVLDHKSVGDKSC